MVSRMTEATAGRGGTPDEAPGTLPLAEREAQLMAELEFSYANGGLLMERLAELELAAEDEGWRRLAFEGENDFTRTGLSKIVSLSRLMYLKNPLIQRAINVRTYYIWGQGVEIHAPHDAVNEVVQDFMDDLGNQAEMFSHIAYEEKEHTLESEGNLFFVLFTNAQTGKVNLRTLPFDEITDVIYNPEDRRDIWFYERTWTEEIFTKRGQRKTKNRKALYPHINHRPRRARNRPAKRGDYEILWDAPVYHVKVGGLATMKFGVPETYAALDWARAYKNYLEDWASIVRAISRFAWRVTTKTKRVGATAARLRSTPATLAGPQEGDRPPAAGSFFVGDDDTDLKPINKSGATTSAEDAKMLRLMVASAMDVPDTMLSNDPQQGALATAKTLDRPTELAMTARQKMWQNVLTDIFRYVVMWSIRAPAGMLTGTVRFDDNDNPVIKVSPDKDKIAHADVAIEFPSVLQADIEDRIDAIIKGLSLDGMQDAGVAEPKLWRKMILTALGVDNVDEILDKMEGEDFGAPDPPPNAGQSLPAADPKNKQHSHNPNDDK